MDQREEAGKGTASAVPNSADQEERAFFAVVERLQTADDPTQVKRLGEKLGRFIFGE
jgi:hypothetical protein